MAWITVPRSSALAEAVVHKGLDNPREAHNCFVNVVLQGLWHLAAFRHALLGAPPHMHTDGRACMTCALRAVFTFYQYGDEASIPPDSVRGVLAALYAEQQRFQSGEMADAGETLMAVLRALHEEHLEATRSLPEGHPRLLAQRAAQTDAGKAAASHSTSPIVLDHDGEVLVQAVSDYASGDDSDEDGGRAGGGSDISEGKRSGIDGKRADDSTGPSRAASGAGGAALTAAPASSSSSSSSSSAAAPAAAAAAMPASHDLMDVPCSPPCPAHAVFSHSFLAWNRCPSCRASSDPVPREDLLYLVYVSDVIEGAAALHHAAAASAGGAAGRAGASPSHALGHRPPPAAGTIDISAHPYYIAGATGTRPSPYHAGQAPLPGLAPPGISYAPGSAAAAAAALGYGAGAVPPGIHTSPLARGGAGGGAAAHAAVLHDPAYTTGVGELSPAQVTAAAGGRPTLGALLSYVAAREEIDSVLASEAAAATSASSAPGSGRGSPAASPALPRRTSRLRSSSSAGGPLLSAASSHGGFGADAPLPPRRPHPPGSAACSDGRFAPERVLLAAPRVFVVSLAWPSDSASKAQVGEAMALLGQLLDMRSIFRLSADMQAAAQAGQGALASPAGCSGGSLAIGPASASSSSASSSAGGAGASGGHATSGNVYRLRGLVCYYGKHWVAFMASESRRSWLLFDDDAVGDVGSWAKVVDRVVRSRYQPTLLFFEQLGDAAPPRTPTASAASMDSAGAAGATLRPVASVPAAPAAEGPVAPVQLRPAGSSSGAGAAASTAASAASPERDLLHMSLMSPTPAQLAAAAAAAAAAPLPGFRPAAHAPAAFPLAPSLAPQRSSGGGSTGSVSGSSSSIHGAAAPTAATAATVAGVQYLPVASGSGISSVVGSTRTSLPGTAASLTGPNHSYSHAHAHGVAHGSAAGAGAGAGVGASPALSADAIVRMLGASSASSAGAIGVGPGAVTPLPLAGAPAGRGNSGGSSAGAVSIASSASATAAPATSHAPAAVASSRSASAPVVAAAHAPAPAHVGAAAAAKTGGEDITVSIPAAALQRIIAQAGLEPVGLRATLGILLAMPAYPAPRAAGSSAGAGGHGSGGAAGGSGAPSSEGGGVQILRVMHSGSTLATFTAGSMGGILPQSHPLARLMSGDVLLAVNGRRISSEADADEALRDAALSAVAALSEGDTSSSSSSSSSASADSLPVGASTVRHATRGEGPKVNITLTVKRRDGPLPGLSGAAAGGGGAGAGRIIVSTGYARMN